VAGERPTSGFVTDTVEAASPPPIGELPVTVSPRLVVLDVDGTLIGPDLQLHPRTRDTVCAAAARLPVILATGRMYRSALPWAMELHVVQPLVCYQGALIRELPHPDGPGPVLFEEGLDPEVALEALLIARAHGWHRQAYQNDELICEEDRPEAHLYAGIARVPITFVDDLAAVVINGTTKLVCVSEDLDIVAECIDTLRAGLGDRARVTRSLEQFVEVVSPRVNKAMAIERVCALLGLSLRDAVAVGDAANDSEMLAGALYGVVVRGARPEVLAAADATCAGPDEAGVADVLEHFGLAG
jgi:Cof subfamily protein (haloacid dehalogenase superfamily)